MQKLTTNKIKRQYSNLHNRRLKIQILTCFMIKHQINLLIFKARKNKSKKFDETKLTIQYFSFSYKWRL